jgi:hypothetical protein
MEGNCCLTNAQKSFIEKNLIPPYKARVEGFLRNTILYKNEARYYQRRDKEEGKQSPRNLEASEKYIFERELAEKKDRDQLEMIDGLLAALKEIPTCEVG